MKNQDLDELMKILENPDELKKQVFNPGKTINEKKVDDIFSMNVPYEDIQKIVFKSRDKIFANISGDSPKPHFEHVGSTSIKDMPGSLSPDALMIEKTFPPSRSTVAAILAAGFFFQSVAPHDPEDLWFWKMLNEGPCKGKALTLHLLPEGSKFAKLMVLTRDTCNNDKEAFEEYRQDKMAARGSQGTSLFDYKMKKSTGSFINKMREKVGLPAFEASNWSKYQK